MSESKGYETPKEVSREEAINAYKPFIEKYKSPDDLDLADPEVIAANNLYNKWQKQEIARAGEDEYAKFRANLLLTMFYVDAGFTDRDYLSEVLNEWLVQDEERLSLLPAGPSREELFDEIEAYKQKINGLLE